MTQMALETVSIDAPASRPGELELLRAETERLRREIDGHEIVLRERQASEEKLQQLVETVTRENVDLKVLVQILIDQGDSAAEEGEKARIDGLTQVANRRRFDEFLEQEWTRHERAHKPLSILILDVDHFKLYNDHYGHQAGDECLKAVATELNHGFRDGDLVARYGGEEFAVIMRNTRGEAAARSAERVCAAIFSAAMPHAASPVCDRVTVSVGVASAIPEPDDTLDSRELLGKADRYLYLAKRRGRNRVCNSSDENENL